MAALISGRPLNASTSHILKHLRLSFNASKISRNLNAESDQGLQADCGDEEFRVYEIEGLKIEARSHRKRLEKKIQPPRFRSMPTDQDWTDVWPTASTFNWSVVPFPVRQGFIESSIENEGVVPGKYANLELMKIPNFLHLTPNHIKKHCEALKEFCTAWPQELDTDEKCSHYFPVEHITCDYLSEGPTPRDPRARTVVKKFYLSDLELDYRARDKFIRLMGDRYNPETDEVVLESDRCPLKSQNLDFLNFVLTAVYFESWKIEPWESLKQLSDMEKYFWDINQSKKSLLSLLKACKQTESSPASKTSKLGYLPEDLSDEDTICCLPQVEQYKEAVSELFNSGESDATLDAYKESVKNVLNLQSGL